MCAQQQLSKLKRIVSELCLSGNDVHVFLDVGGLTGGWCMYSVRAKKE